jgi:hypothetical protein
MLICDKTIINALHQKTLQRLQNKMFSYMQHKSKYPYLSYPYHHKLATHKSPYDIHSMYINYSL